MRAIQPDRSRRRVSSFRGASSIASTAWLIAVAAVAVMTTGCDDKACDRGTNESGGLGGQTYTAPTAVGQTNAELIFVIRGGGSSAPAATAGVLTQEISAGSVDGVLVFESGLREILAGTFDPSLVEEPGLQISSAEGTTFEGIATTDFFTGTLEVPNIATVTGVSGPGRQVDAPMIDLVGLWQHVTDIEVGCGTLGTFNFQCAGNTRIRPAGRNVRMDTYESCAQGPFECFLSGPALTEGSWRGLNYSEPVSSTETFQGCRLQIDGTLNLSVDSVSLSSTTTATATFLTADCLPTGTECSLLQTMNATRCVDCWPAECNET